MKQWIGREVEWGKDVGCAGSYSHLCLIGKWVSSGRAKIYDYYHHYSSVHSLLVRTWDTVLTERHIKNEMKISPAVRYNMKDTCSNNSRRKNKPFGRFKGKRFLCVSSPSGFTNKVIAGQQWARTGDHLDPQYVSTVGLWPSEGWQQASYLGQGHQWLKVAGGHAPFDQVLLLVLYNILKYSTHKPIRHHSGPCGR